MKSTMASTGEVIDFDTGDRMAAPAQAGHNNPPIDLPDNFKVDYARALRWKAYNTPKLNKGDGFLLCFLSDHFKFGGNGANIPISYICRIMGEAERTVQRRIERLSKLDWVGKEEARGTIPTRWSVILTPEEYEEQISRAIQAVRKKAVRDDKSDTPRPPRGDNPDASTHIGVTNLTPLGQQVQCEPFRGDNPDAPTGCQNALEVTAQAARGDNPVTQQPIQIITTTTTDGEYRHPTLEDWENRRGGSAPYSFKGSTLRCLNGGKVEYTQETLAAFGNVATGKLLADEFSKLTGMLYGQAVEKLEKDAALCGAFNVAEAVRLTRSKSNVKNPLNYYDGTVGKLASKHGPRQMPVAATERDARIERLRREGL